LERANILGKSLEVSEKNLIFVADKSITKRLKIMIKRIFLMLIVAFACTLSANAQSWLNRLKDRAVNAAENAVTRKVENKVDRETSDAMDNVLDGKKKDKSSKSKILVRKY
jgi:uncharacterized membrane protein YvbJ